MLLFVSLHWDLKAMFVCVKLLSKRERNWYLFIDTGENEYWNTFENWEVISVSEN